MKKESLTLVMFGGTGDLAKLKLASAFAELIHKGILKSSSTIIGISRGNYTDKSYRTLLMSSVKDKKEKHHLKKINIRFVRMDVSKASEIGKLDGVLKVCEPGSCNRVYYLATSFKFFPTILLGLKEHGLISKKDKFNRIAFEKPFGSSMKSSDALERKVSKIINEKHIFRVDHYLGKESVQNLLKMKKINLNNKTLEKIEIIADESLGVENRIEYYNDAGALKDMIQSHLLQVLALLLIEDPKKFDAKNIRDEKVKILKKIKLINKGNYVFGQYQSYKKEALKYNIKNSKTDTFVKVFLNCDSKRWDGIEISLRAGKKLPKKLTRINLFFKDGKKKFIILKAREGYGTRNDYEILLEDILIGDKHFFVRNDELHEMWRVTDKIEKVKSKSKLIIYKDYTYPEAKL